MSIGSGASGTVPFGGGTRRRARLELSLTIFGERNAVTAAVQDYLNRQPDVELLDAWQRVDGSIVVALEDLDEQDMAVELPGFPAGSPARPTLYLIAPMYEDRTPRDPKDWVTQIEPGAAVAAETALTDVERWLEDLFSGGGAGERLSTPDGQARAAIENLTGYISTILDNGYLKRLVRDLESELKATKRELTEASIQARAFKALYEQLRLDNDALKQELSKGTVDRKGATTRALLLRGAWLSLFASGFLGNVMANEFDHIRRPDEDILELQDAQQKLPERCDQTIIILDGGSATSAERPSADVPRLDPEQLDERTPPPTIDPRKSSGEPDVIGDPTQKWPDDHAQQTFTLDESTLDGPDRLG